MKAVLEIVGLSDCAFTVQLKEALCSACGTRAEVCYLAESSASLEIVCEECMISGDKDLLFIDCTDAVSEIRPPTTPPPKQETVEEEEESIHQKVERLYKEGKSVREIAREVGRTAQTIHQHIQRIKREQE